MANKGKTFTFKQFYTNLNEFTQFYNYMSIVKTFTLTLMWRKGFTLSGVVNKFQNFLCIYSHTHPTLLKINVMCVSVNKHIYDM